MLVRLRVHCSDFENNTLYTVIDDNITTAIANVHSGLVKSTKTIYNVFG